MQTQAAFPGGYHNPHYVTDVLAGVMLERYFERKLRETGRYTRIGGYWDRKGEDEIDLIAVNKIEKTAEVYEIKKQGKRYDEAASSEKIEYLLQNSRNCMGCA